MAGERNFLRIPPDSTGKRIRQVHGAQLFYSNKDSGYLWKTDRNYMLGDGWTIHVHKAYEETGLSGMLDVSFADLQRHLGTLPTAGTDIIDPDTDQVIARVESYHDLYTNAQNIVGYTNPENGLDIDETGSMNVRFSEGVPQLDAFGKLRTSGASLLGEYRFSDNISKNLFSRDRSLAGGSVAWDKPNRCALLTVDTNTGSRVSYTSDTYHHYTPGASQLAMCSVASGDSGKAGLHREWGYGDDRNGFFFVNRDGVNAVLIRSQLDGVSQPTEILIEQSNWNVDRLDGTGRSRMDLDITRNNIYWVDVQGGAACGRIRFGTFYAGERVVVHEHMTSNDLTSTATGSGSLPIRFAQENTAGTGSTSELRAFSAVVWTEVDIQLNQHGLPQQRTLRATLDATNGVYQYVGALRPIAEYDAGITNRTMYMPVELEVMAWDTVTGEDVRVEVEMTLEPVLSGASWSPISPVIASPTIEYDSSATMYHPGIEIYETMSNGHSTSRLDSVFTDTAKGAVKNYAENGGFEMYPIASISNTSPAVMEMSYGMHGLREGFASTILNAAGMTEINGTEVYMKITGLATAELYLDADFTTPVDATGWGTYVAHSGIQAGYFGLNQVLAISVKKLYGSNPADVVIKLGWKELR